MKLGNLATRIITAAVLIPLLVLIISWEQAWGVWALVYAVSLASAHEYFTIMLDDATDRRFGMLMCVVLGAVMYWVPGGLVAALPAAIIVPALYYLFRFRDLAQVTQRLGQTSFGIFYAGLLLHFVSLLKRDFGGNGADWVYLVLFTAWWGDTMAYVAGRLFGKKKLYPAISPGKTWAGGLGGVFGSVLGSVVANVWFFPELGWVHGVVATAVGAFLGQTGDLVESMMKRARGVKDSGTLLPGHGGMLDRIDAVIFIAPWMYLYALFAWS